MSALAGSASVGVGLGRITSGMGWAWVAAPEPTACPTSRPRPQPASLASGTCPNPRRPAPAPTMAVPPLLLPPPPPGNRLPLWLYGCLPHATLMPSRPPPHIYTPATVPAPLCLPLLQASPSSRPSPRRALWLHRQAAAAGRMLGATPGCPWLVGPAVIRQLPGGWVGRGLRPGWQQS